MSSLVAEAVENQNAESSVNNAVKTAVKELSNGTFTKLNLTEPGKLWFHTKNGLFLYRYPQVSSRAYGAAVNWKFHCEQKCSPQDVVDAKEQILSILKQNVPFNVTIESKNNGSTIFFRFTTMTQDEKKSLTSFRRTFRTFVNTLNTIFPESIRINVDTLYNKSYVNVVGSFFSIKDTSVVLNVLIKAVNELFGDTVRIEPNDLRSFSITKIGSSVEEKLDPKAAAKKAARELAMLAPAEVLEYKLAKALAWVMNEALRQHYGDLTVRYRFSNPNNGVTSIVHEYSIEFRSSPTHQPLGTTWYGIFGLKDEDEGRDATTEAVFEATKSVFRAHGFTNASPVVGFTNASPVVSSIKTTNNSLHFDFTVSITHDGFEGTSADLDIEALTQTVKQAENALLEVIAKMNGISAEKVDWRPTETVPEDFYAL